MTDNVNHPAHYGGADDPYEVIKILEARSSPERYEGFLEGNVHKYLFRAGKKGSKVEDYGKAKWYMDRLYEYAKREMDDRCES